MCRRQHQAKAGASRQARSAGKTLPYAGGEITVRELSAERFDGIDVALFSASGTVSREVAPEFLAGSHRWGRLFYPRTFDDGIDYAYEGPGYETIPDIEAERDRHRILAWAMQPGDAVAFKLSKSIRV